MREFLEHKIDEIKAKFAAATTDLERETYSQIYFELKFLLSLL